MNAIANKIVSVKDTTSIATRKLESKRALGDSTPALCDAAVQRFPTVKAVNTVKLIRTPKGAIESVRIIGVTVLIGLNLKKM